MPDALSRIPLEGVGSLVLAEPDTDLNFSHFNDQDYKDLKYRIEQNSGKFPDVRVIDRYVYIRTNYYSDEENQENESWKLWVPSKLRESVIKRAHDIPTAGHGGTAKTLKLIRRHFFGQV